MHVQVDMVVEIDPDRVDEWIHANFDTESESVKVTDLSCGDGVAAPVVADEGPYPIDMAQRAMEDELNG